MPAALVVANLAVALISYVRRTKTS
jgi:hypothetical protein